MFSRHGLYLVYSVINHSIYSIQLESQCCYKQFLSHPDLLQVPIKSFQHLYHLPYELSTTPFPLILLVSQIPNFGPILATPSIQKSISSLFYQ